MIGLSDITIVYGISNAYWPLTRLSLATVPEGVTTIVSWYGRGAPDDLPASTRLVRPRNVDDNFARGYVLNVGVRAAETDYIALSDASFLYGHGYFEEVKRRCDPETIVRAYVGRFTRAATQRVLARKCVWDSLYSEFQGTRGRVFDKILGEHNPCVYPRGAFARLGGYDERMKGWGREDVDLSWRSARLGLKNHRVPVIVGCLYDNDLSDCPAYQHGRWTPLNRQITANRKRPASANPNGWGDGDKE